MQRPALEPLPGGEASDGLFGVVAGPPRTLDAGELELAGWLHPDLPWTALELRVERVADSGATGEPLRVPVAATPLPGGLAASDVPPGATLFRSRAIAAAELPAGLARFTLEVRGTGRGEDAQPRVIGERILGHTLVRGGGARWPALLPWALALVVLLSPLARMPWIVVLLVLGQGLVVGHARPPAAPVEIGGARGATVPRAYCVDPREQGILAGRDWSPARPFTAGRVEDVVVERDRASLRVVVDGDALLVLEERSAPGWSCAVDGESHEVWTTTTGFRAVPVGAGEHVVVFRYWPPYLTLGLVLCGLAVVASAGLALSDRRP